MFFTLLENKKSKNSQGLLSLKSIDTITHQLIEGMISNYHYLVF